MRLHWISGVFSLLLRGRVVAPWRWRRSDIIHDDFSLGRQGGREGRGPSAYGDGVTEGEEEKMYLDVVWATFMHAWIKIRIFFTKHLVSE